MQYPKKVMKLTELVKEWGSQKNIYRELIDFQRRGLLEK